MGDHRHGTGRPEPNEPTQTQQLFAFLAAFAFGCIATADLVEQRVDHNSRVGIWLGAASMVCALQLFLCAQTALGALSNRSSVWTELHSMHVLGATAGVLAVHAFFAMNVLPHDSALVECPAQLVNDAALVGCVLVLLWAVVARTQRAGIAWFVIALLARFAYVRTAVHWHCDHITEHPVQDYVASQLTATLDGVAAFLSYMALARRAA